MCAMKLPGAAQVCRERASWGVFPAKGDAEVGKPHGRARPRSLRRGQEIHPTWL